MIDGMHIVNLWEQLRTWDDEQLKRAVPSFDGDELVFDPLGERGDHKSPLMNQLLGDEGEILQVDYFRPDGTLLATHRRKRLQDETSAFTLCDRPANRSAPGRASGVSTTSGSTPSRGIRSPG